MDGTKYVEIVGLHKTYTVEKHYKKFTGYLFFLSFFRSGLRGPKDYSLWGGVVPYPSIGQGNL